MQVTNLEQLKIMAECDVIELPPFKEGMPFIAKVKRVSLMGLLRKGLIPNSLLSAAEELFYGKKSSRGNADLDQLTNVMYTMAENALVEPSMETLNDVGLELTDEQLVALFNYTQKGVNALKPFHTESEDNINNNDGEAVQAEAE